MDSHREDHSNTRRPPQNIRSKQLSTHNVPTDDEDNTNGTKLGKDLLLIDKPRNLPQATKRMPQENQKHRRTTIYIYIYILNKSKAKRKNLAIAWIDTIKANDLVPQSWIIHCLKMHK